NVSNINSVVVNAGKGNDTVSLSGLTTAWTKQIRVTSAAGTDRVRLLDGSLTSLVGTNKSLTIPANNGGGGGDGGGGGTSGDWFDTNINDAALRSLLRTDY